MTLAARSLRLDGDLDTFRERCRVFAEGFAKEIVAEDEIRTMWRHETDHQS